MRARLVQLGERLEFSIEEGGQASKIALKREFLSLLILVLAIFMVVFGTSAATAQTVDQKWPGIVPGSNNYSSPVPYDTPQQACESMQNSFVPRFGYEVYSLTYVRWLGEQPNPFTGANAPAFQCEYNTDNHGIGEIWIFLGCSQGKLVTGACLPISYPVTAEPMCKGNKGGAGQFPAIGDPCSLSTGAKIETVTDYSSGGPNPIEIKRYYRSMMMPIGNLPLGMGAAWRNNLVGRQIVTESYSLSTPYNVVITREDGAQSRFLNPDIYRYGLWNQYSIETFVENADVRVDGVSDEKDKLKQISLWTFEYTDEDDRVDTFETAASVGYPSGLRKSVWKGGYQRNYVYASNDINLQRPIQINDSFGRIINITWNGDVVTAIEVPDQIKIQYSYEPLIVNGNPVAGSEVLTQVTRYKADGTLIDTIGYQYDRSRTSTTVPLLTGVIDAKGVLVDSTTYDDAGRVLTAQGPDGANAISITYDDNAGTNTGTRTVTNALGQVSTYTMVRDASWNTRVPSLFKLRSIARQQNPTAPAATMTQSNDSNGFVASRTDWNGLVTNFTNDANGNEIQRIEDFNGLKRTVNATWSSTFRLPTQIVSPNLTVDMTYDTSGRLTQRKETDTSVRNGPVRIWNYTYNALGLLETVTGPRTDVTQTTTYTYDAQGNLATVKDALNRVTTIASVNAAGLPLSVADQNGVVTNMTYDPLGRITSASVQGPVPATTSFVYDLDGLLTSVTSPNGVTLTYGYDAAHRLTSITDGVGNKTVFALDGLGNRTQTQIQTAGAQVLMANSATFDTLGRLLTSIGAANQTTAYEYDNNGNLTKLTDPRSAVTQNAFDGLNRLKQTTDALNAVITTGYDLRDNVTSITDPKAHATTYTVNGFGFVTQVVSPDSGTTTYTYDLAGNVLSRKDARKVVTNYTYDALNRPLTRTYPSSTTENVTFGYDATAGGNKGVGRLTSLTDAAGTASFTYDDYGNRVTETRTIAGVAYTTSYAYDLAGELTKITYPSGRIVNYQRDGLGQVAGVTTQANAAAGAVTLASNVVYLPFGPMTAATLGNGVQLTDSYDLDYRLTDRQAVGSATLQNLTLGYDPASNIASIADGVTSGLSQTYQYDLVGRVKQGTGVWGTDNYTYDALGNRLTRSLVNGSTTTTTYTYATANTQLTKAVTGSSTLNYAYAADGSLLTRKLGNTTQASYTYNADGRMSASGSAALKYNGFGERAVETITGGGTHFLFSPDGLLLAEHTTTGTAVRNYVYLNGQPLAIVDAAGAISYVLNDQVGQPQKMLNPGGTVSWQRNSGIFGDTVSQPVGTTASNPLRFPGQQFDPNIALHYNYFRDYDPSTGRYIETDPIGLSGGANLYVYAGGNPVSNVDPDGRIFWLAPMIIGAGIGAATDMGFQLLMNGGNWDCIDPLDVGVSAALGALGGGLGSVTRVASRGKEFSHALPDRWFRPLSLSGKSANGHYKPLLDNPLMNKFANSSLNGNYVSPKTHALTDPYRNLAGMTKADTLPPALRWPLRLPAWLGGSAAGSAAGLANSASDCECQ